MLINYPSQAEKRAHHNMLERKRRDHIKDSFVSLRDSVPALQGEKVLMLNEASSTSTFSQHLTLISPVTIYMNLSFLPKN
jgi:hypothetical protein